MELRPHQTLAIQKTRESFANGKKHICLCCSVASGKTLIAKNIIDSALAKNKKVGFFSFRVILIEQMKKYFKDIPNIEIGTLQYYNNRDVNLDLAIFDEKDFHNTKLKNNINSSYSITLSGSPVDSYGYPLDFDEIIDIIQIPDLIELGYAKKIKCLASQVVNTDSLKRNSLDFLQKDSFQLMNKAKMYTDIVGAYKKYCLDRVSILFAVNIQHAEILKEEFLKAGVECDTTHSKKDNQSIKDFENGKFKLLINVAQLTTGYDFVDINCVIFARPMASIPLFIQCIGRGIRLNPKNKDDDCLVLDLCEVIKRTGHHPLQRLDLTRKKTDKNQVLCKKCKCKMKLINRETKTINEYEYSVITNYKCECGHFETIENLKLFNNSICENCNNIFESKDGIQMTKNEKNVLFEMECNFCGHKRKFRELLLTDDELKEIKLEEAMKNGSSWEDVSILLKHYCKQDGYHHRYATRLMDTIKARGYTPDLAIKNIQLLRKQGKKISYLMYIKD